MKAYRVPFFVGLASRLHKEGVGLEVAYGEPWAEEAKRGDHVDLPAPLGRRLPSRMLGGKLLWMPALKPVLKADAVIVEHANKHLLNYALMAAQGLGIKRLAYWGHGRDRQADSAAWGERFKQRSLHWADWWFAYTAGAAAYVAEQGFDPTRITTIGNAVDTRELREQVASVSESERSEAWRALGLEAAGPCVVYCGSLYENKRLDLMLPAMDAVQARLPGVKFIVIGGGPLAPAMQAYAETRPWVRYAGPKFGRDKAVLLSLASIWLNPGLVGLGILDAFSAGLPLVTTDLPVHSPEIEYLEHGVNGVMVRAEVSALVDELLGLLQSPVRLQLLREGALASAECYSIESMVESYAQGVLKWLT
ncbi:hypothetical protein GCM10027046_13810 [Uliginosibacterium flavum]|uniref:Glycosyltransferase family 4 protein n=1 Tax=Uliginosibacterium flavum TaxID=1396831 RepID=A0ABV2TQV6_9RHOO